MFFLPVLVACAIIVEKCVQATNLAKIVGDQMCATSSKIDI